MQCVQRNEAREMLGRAWTEAIAEQELQKDKSFNR